MYTTEFPPLGVATDAALTVRFHTAKPQIILIRRKHEQQGDKLYFPGGHFDVGLWKETSQQFVGHPQIEGIKFDVSLRACVSRETGEEVHVLVYPGEWTFLVELDAPDRDPRSDMRRVSLAYWKDLLAIPDSIKADDDVYSYHVVNLMDLIEESMGFDHWIAIEILQEKWRAYADIWKESPTYGWIHACRTLKAAMPNPTDKIRLSRIVYQDDCPQFILFSEGSEHTLPGMTTFCPHCGADLTLPPAE
jgi:ADP-ribose pyrophosphatase YjhB (NUDIX family)